MKPTIYFFPIALLALGAWCVWQAAQGWWREQRLAERIGQIGHDRRYGTVQRLTAADFEERRR